MKVQLVANLAINGQVILQEQSAAYQAPQKIAGMGFEKAMECGSLIIGRTTYEMFLPFMIDLSSTLNIVVLTSKEIDGVKTCCDVTSAIEYLKSKNVEMTCVVGGIATYNAFFKENKVDEIFFNLFPVVIEKGGILEGNLFEYRLEELTRDEDIVMLHYKK